MLIPFLFKCSKKPAEPTKPNIIYILADDLGYGDLAGNEVDDLFAVSRALIAPEIEIVGLNSTQWQNSHWAV